MIWRRSVVEQRQAETTIRVRRESLYGEQSKSQEAHDWLSLDVEMNSNVSGTLFSDD
jgi:hypothetical protein